MTQIPAVPQIPARGAVPGRLQLIARSIPARLLPPPHANRVLAAVPLAGFQRILAHFESVNMAAGEVLYEAGREPRHLYFPTTAIVSLVCETADGASCEICAVGNDGVVGFELCAGSDTTWNRAIVTSAGHGYRLEARHIKREFGDTALLIAAMQRYTQSLIAQIAQIAVCYRHHSVEQQLCRRLLFSLDRQTTGELLMTHGLIADMLGVRRESISTAAGKLQSSGVIRCFRGHIKILDRPGLERRACECYRKKSGPMVSMGLRVARAAA
jgi:CRP-like cAMP-binding protein